MDEKQINEFIHNNEWNALAKMRFDQITSGLDITYTNFLLPHLYEYLPVKKSILDVGCGVGIGTNFFSKSTNTIVGIDPSEASIALAKENFPTIEFQCTDMENFESDYKFQVAIINMVLHNCPHIHNFLANLKRVMSPKGTIIIAMCHPDYWLEYKEIDPEKYILSNEEKLYQIPFTITNSSTSHGDTSYYHREINYYLTAFSTIKAQLISSKSPMPTPQLAKLYPILWKQPRFWFVKLSLS